MQNPKWRLALPILILTLIAFALSIYGLDRHSLRGDEAFDAVFITQPVPAWLGDLGTSQPYPPVYHLALTAWVFAAGNSVFALRFLSALSAVLTVPLTYQLGRMWFGSTAGRWAALLAAFQPIVLWYAQDRLYAPLLALALASTACAVALWQGRQSKRRWFGYVTLTLLSLGVHYVALLMVIAHNLIALGLGLRRNGKRWWLKWLSVQSLIGLAYLPWIAFAWPVLTSHTSTWAQPATLAEMLVRLFRAYSVGLTITTPELILPIPGFALALAIGFFNTAQQSDRDERLSALALILMPIGCVAILSLSRPMFDERYLVFIIPPYLTLLGRGLAVIRFRWGRAGLAAFMLTGMSIATINDRFDPRFAKAPDWNAVFDFFREHARPTDAIVYTYPDPAPEYYVQGRWPIFLLPPQSPPDRDATTQHAQEIAASHPRIWLIPQWSPSWDEHRLAEQILDALAERAAELSVGRVPLVLYHTPVLYTAERTTLDATLDGSIHLIGAAMRQVDGNVTDRLTAHPDETIRVTLYWQADQRPQTEYSVFLHLLDGAGHMHTQRDGWPRDGAYPTSWWQPGATIVDTRVLSIPPDTPPGRYTLVTGMYGLDGTRLPVSGTHADAANARVILPFTIEIQSP